MHSMPDPSTKFCEGIAEEFEERICSKVGFKSKDEGDWRLTVFSLTRWWDWRQRLWWGLKKLKPS